MVATVNVQEFNGEAPGEAHIITQGRYATTDNYNPGLSNPCVVPTTGFNYSYWKTHNIAFSGQYTQISNIRWYTSGAIRTNWNLGTDAGLFVGVKSINDSGLPIANYAQATGVQGTSGNWMDDASNGHPYYKPGSSNYATPVSADTYTSSNTLLVDSTVYSYNPAGGQTKCVVTQVKIATDAVQGDKASETITWRYDEI